MHPQILSCDTNARSMSIIFSAAERNYSTKSPCSNSMNLWMPVRVLLRETWMRLGWSGVRGSWGERRNGRHFLLIFYRVWIRTVRIQRVKLGVGSVHTWGQVIVVGVMVVGVSQATGNRFMSQVKIPKGLSSGSGLASTIGFLFLFLMRQFIPALLTPTLPNLPTSSACSSPNSPLNSPSTSMYLISFSNSQSLQYNPINLMVLPISTTLLAQFSIILGTRSGMTSPPRCRKPSSVSWPGAKNCISGARVCIWRQLQMMVKYIFRVRLKMRVRWRVFSGTWDCSYRLISCSLSSNLMDCGFDYASIAQVLMHLIRKLIICVLGLTLSSNPNNVTLPLSSSPC